jgi:hypothetical protein
MISVAFGLTCLGCILLSLSLRRHHSHVFVDTAAYETRRWSLRLAGYGCLLLALAPCVRLAGVPIGLTLWVSMAALAAFLQILLLTYRPKASAAFGGGAIVLIALGLLR